MGSVIPAFDALFDFVVIHELATIGGGDALLDFTDEPLVVVHHALHGFDYQRFAVAALLGGEFGALGLKVGAEMYSHGYRVEFAGEGVNIPARAGTPGQKPFTRSPRKSPSTAARRFD